MRRPDFDGLKQKASEALGRGAMSKKAFRLGGYSVLSGIIVVLIAVFAILASESLSSKYTKLDFTSGKLFSISGETENVVKGLTKDVQIYYITTSGSEDQLVENILQRYDDLSSRLTVSVQDPAINPSFGSEYTSEQVSLNSIIVVCGEKSRYISHDELYETQTDYQTYSQTREFVGESSITSAVSYVSGDKFPKIYITSGHGEEELSASMKEAVKKSNVETEEISLLTAESIPEDAAGLMIYEPSTDISDSERDLILSYLKSGGNLMLFTGYIGEPLANIDALMSNYGMVSENTMVFEGDNSKCVRGYNYYLVPDMGEHDILTPIKEAGYSVLAPLAKPIKMTYSKPDTAVITTLLSTSNSAYKKTNIQSTTEKEAGDEEGKCVVGATVLDKTDSGDAHILWITSGRLLDENVNQLVSGANQDLLLNAINWMGGREEGIAIHPKSLAAEYLTVSSGAATLWSIVLVFVIPVIVLVFGIYVWIRRKSR